MSARKQQIFGLMMAFKRKLGEKIRRSKEGEDHQSMIRTATLFIVRGESPTMKGLATHLGIRPPSATSLILSLERAGLLKRERDTKDRRLYRLRLTKKGDNALKKKEKTIEDAMGEILKSLSDKEQDTFISILKKITTV